MKKQTKKDPKGALYPWELFYTKPEDPMNAVLKRYIKASNAAFAAYSLNKAAAFFLLLGASAGACFGPLTCIFGAFCGVCAGLLLPWGEK